MWGKKVSVEKLERIKEEAITIQKIKDTLDTLGTKIEEHLELDSKKFEEIKKVVASCPEGPHIEKQNGLIKEQGEELVKQGKTQNKIFGTLIFCGVLLSFLLGAVFYLAREDRESSVRIEVQRLDERIDKYMDTMNLKGRLK